MGPWRQVQTVGLGLAIPVAASTISLAPPPQAYERQIPPRAVINSAGYKILTSLDQYLELVGNSLPGKGTTHPRPGAQGFGRREWGASLVLELQAPCPAAGLELVASTQHNLNLQGEA